ncbi:hypothetical protein N9W34_06960, partial [Rickettsiales bacterium]|nr:hypothetical protein [Rickettsiales bacterium]
AILEQNKKYENITTSEKRDLNRRWYSEIRKSQKTLIKKTLDNDVSKFLKYIQDQSEGLYTELIIVDEHGINVGQSTISRDFWQENTEKWKNTFGSKSYAAYVGDLKYDDTTGFFQAEVSFMIVHEDKPIGIAYAGVDIEQYDEDL